MTNKSMIRGTSVSEKDLRCGACSGTYQINQTATFDSGKGMFYAECDLCHRTKNFEWHYKTVTHSKRELNDEFSVLDALGGDITGEYKKDRERTPHVYYSEDLYNRAYQLSEQP